MPHVGEVPFLCKVSNGGGVLPGSGAVDMRPDWMDGFREMLISNMQQQQLMEVLCTQRQEMQQQVAEVSERANRCEARLSKHLKAQSSGLSR